MKAAARNGAGAQTAGASTAAQLASGSAKATTAASHATLGNNLRTDRVAAILPRAACTSDEIVLPAASEARVAALSGASFSHVEWRSIAEVIQYLGALLRPQTPLDNATWLEPAADPASPVRHFVFRLVAGNAPGFASIDYRGTRYVIGPEGNPPALRDPALPRCPAICQRHRRSRSCPRHSQAQAVSAARSHGEAPRLADRSHRKKRQRMLQMPTGQRSGRSPEFPLSPRAVQRSKP